MKAKETLFHINWGDGDTSFVIAPDEETAKDRMADGKDMVNYIVKLDSLYQRIFKAGIKEVVEWVEQNRYQRTRKESLRVWNEDWQAKLKEWG